MAGKNDGLLCLICMQSPCACNKPQGDRPRKATPKPVVKCGDPTVESPAKIRPSFTERMRAEAREKSAKEKQARLDALRKRDAKPRARFTETMTDEQAALLAAVRALSEVFEIHPDDLAPFKDKLSRPATVEERAKAWRYRRSDSKDSGS